MNIIINKEEFETLLQVEEFLESEIYSTGNSKVDNNILMHIGAIIYKASKSKGANNLNEVETEWCNTCEKIVTKKEGK